ncbi:MAG: hypothetical protein ABI678_27810 [Kofleriaceae bacterium]
MGWIDWLRAKKPAAAKTTASTEQFRTGLAAAVDANDARSILQACHALTGLGATAFGSSITELHSDPVLLASARSGLEVVLARLPDDRIRPILNALERSSLELDLSGLRERDGAYAQHATAALLERIESFGADELVDVLVSLESTTIAGVTIPREWAAHDRLRDHAQRRLVEVLIEMPVGPARDVLRRLRAQRGRFDFAAPALRSLIATVSIDEPRNPKLEAAIAAEPDVADNYAVLGDWLAERGHPRGELIALCLRAERDPATEPAVRAHVEHHADALIGSVLDADEILGAITWRRGFIDTLEPSDVDTLTWVLGHPSARALRELRIPSSLTEELDWAVVTALVPASLSALVLGDPGETGYVGAAIDPGPLHDVCARLRTLVLHGRLGDGLALDAPLLTTLQIETIGITPATVDALTAATLPALTRLDLWIGDPEREPGAADDGAALLAALAQLLARTDLPALRHLSLVNADLADEVCALIAKSPLAVQLEVLDLSYGVMSDAGVETLVATRLPRLATVIAKENCLTSTGIARLTARFTTTHTEDQKSDRYISINE